MNSEFITVDEAIKLIESDSRENPVVDIKQMTDSYTYIELAHNFRIPLLAVNKDGFIVENGNRYITFEKEIDVLRFREVVLNHYKETTSAKYDEEAITNPTKSITQLLFLRTTQTGLRQETTLMAKNNSGVETPNLTLLRSLVGSLTVKIKAIENATYAELPEAESEANAVFQKINMVTGQAQLEVQAIADKRRQEVR